MIKCLIIEDQWEKYLDLVAYIGEVFLEKKVSKYDVHPYIRSKYELSEVNFAEYDLIFIDFKLWEEKKDGFYYAKLCREINEDAYILLITAYAKEAKSANNIYEYFNGYIQKEVEKEELKVIIDDFFIHKKKVYRRNLIGNFNQGPKKGNFAKNEEYRDYYYDFISNSKNIQLIERNTKLWTKELLKFIDKPNHRVSSQYLKMWKANETPFSKKAIKSNKTLSIFQNIITWRRVILSLYIKGKNNNLPEFVEFRELCKVENNNPKAIETVRLASKKYNLKDVRDYNHICLKGLYSLYTIHTYGEYSMESFSYKYESQMKNFISTFLGFSYKSPYIQFDETEYSDLFKEEIEYFQKEKLI